jgi:hypothetical protein
MIGQPEATGRVVLFNRQYKAIWQRINDETSRRIRRGNLGLPVVPGSAQARRAQKPASKVSVVDPRLQETAFEPTPAVQH